MTIFRVLVRWIFDIDNNLGVIRWDIGGSLETSNGDDGKETFARILHQKQGRFRPQNILGQSTEECKWFSPNFARYVNPERLHNILFYISWSVAEWPDRPTLLKLATTYQFHPCLAVLKIVVLHQIRRPTLNLLQNKWNKPDELNVSDAKHIIKRDVRIKFWKAFTVLDWRSSLRELCFAF